MDQVLKEELERAVKFFNSHNVEVVREKYRTSISSEDSSGYYEIPVVDLALTCISCQHSHRLIVGRVPDRIKVLSYYAQDIPECKQKSPVDNNSYTKEELLDEIDSILGEKIEEIEDIIKYEEENKELLRYRVKQNQE